MKSPKQPKNDIEKRHDENRVFLFNAFVLQSELCRLKYTPSYSETSFSGQQHSVIVKLFSRLLTVESQKVLKLNMGLEDRLKTKTISEYGDGASEDSTP